MTQDDLIRKINALLAKAESTTYPEEAKSFFAKANQLMIEYSVNAHQLRSKNQSEKPIQVNFEYARSHYLSAGKKAVIVIAARACGVAIILRPDLKGNEGHKLSIWCTLIGFKDDIDITQSLFLSLMIQAQGSMTVTAYVEKTGYLMGFAFAVKERFNQMQRQSSEVSSTAIVLRSRDNEVMDAMHGFFPHLAKSKSMRNTNATGMKAGREAGSQADIGLKKIRISPNQLGA